MRALLHFYSMMAGLMVAVGCLATQQKADAQAAVRQSPASSLSEKLIDVSLEPPWKECPKVGEELVVRIDVDREIGGPYGGMQVLIHYDPAHLMLLEFVSTQDNWTAESGFPDDAWGINDDIGDGEALLVLHPADGWCPWAPSTVGKLYFKTIAYDSSCIEIDKQVGAADIEGETFCVRTEVWACSGEIATGGLGCACVVRRKDPLPPGGFQ